MPRSTSHDILRDAFYTPARIADEVMSAASIVPRLVLDPAVGDGSLLRAAGRAWPEVQAIGFDVDRGQLERTRSQHPEWSLGRLDMYSSRSRASSALWRSCESNVDVVVLNPPFSYRGGRSRRVIFDGSEHSLTPASAFIALSLSRLSDTGELLALLPAGVLAVERDSDFWSSVAARWDVETLARFSSTTFSGTRARSVLLSVRPPAGAHEAEIVDLPVPSTRCIELIRGRVPVHTVRGNAIKGNSAPFLHTKDLGALHDVVATSQEASIDLATTGPFLTLPRVGRVLPNHIKIVKLPREVVLSDCVFALRAEYSDLLRLQEMLLAELEDLQAEYAGGCAPYLTIRRLVHFLAQRGYCVHHVAASDPACSSRGRTDPTRSVGQASGLS